jgi:hypothetical protein
MSDPCVAAAEKAGLTECHAEACEDRRYGCAGCPFEDGGALRDGHRADCAARGLTDEEEASEWEAFKADYERWLDDTQEG